MTKGCETVGRHRGDESEEGKGVRLKFGMVGKWTVHVQLQT